MTSETTHKAATPIDGKVVIKDLPRPVAVKNTIVIKNKVTGVNFADIHQVSGKYPLSEAGIVGLEK
jgi:NADPH:quinone reductase-like Zn-dependent oxidoreductase